MSSETHAIQLQPRDLKLLQGLLGKPFMLLDYISFMYFGGHREGAKKRVQRLTADGYLRQQRRPPSKPSIYFLTRKAFAVLKKHGMMEGFPSLSWVRLQRHMRLSASIIEHELGILEVEMALASAASNVPSVHVSEFNTRSEAIQFFSYKQKGYGAPKVLMIPDAFIKVNEQAANRDIDHAFFLELDRSTESLETLVGKAMCYANYYKSGDYAKWMGRPDAAIGEFPFRVLLVLETSERRDQIVRRLSESESHMRGQVWLTTKNEILTDPFGEIWIQTRRVGRPSENAQGLSNKIRRSPHNHLRHNEPNGDVRKTSFLNSK